jgi:pyruvate kinase
MSRSAKIVATIGPACSQPASLTALMRAGVNVARLNFSHGSHEDHAAVIARLRAAANELHRPLCILQDLQGPKIRTGSLPSGPVTLTAGQALTLSVEPVRGTIPVDFPEIIESAEVGKHILLDDGNLELEVTAVTDKTVETRVILGGVLKSHKGINLPGARINIPGFTPKDAEDLKFGLAQGVDAVAVSFVRSGDDLRAVRQAMREFSTHAENVPIIAKLERPEALDNLEEIVALADGVMVARGDLGVEMPPESVPIAQKRIIHCANRHGKIVITATQMLDSMIHNPRPTRAEASDVANAIFDGTDAVMLSGETASGEYPVAAVEMMSAIVQQAETHLDEWGHWKGSAEPLSSQDDTHFVTLAARELAHDRNVAAIAVFTQTGRTALMMSKTRPGVPVLGFTPRPEIYRRMAFYWGVTPYLVPHSNTIEDMLTAVETVMTTSTDLAPGQQVVLVCGFPLPAVKPSNLALLHTIGER